MKKLITLFLLLFTCLLTTDAIPVKSKPVTVTQSDGSQLTVTIRGGEVFLYRSTLDGVPLAKGADGDFYYAEFTDKGWQPTAVRAHNADERTDSEEVALAERLKQQAQSMMQQCLNNVKKARASHRLKSLRNNSPKSDTGLYTGERRGLVILVNYQDVAFSEADPQQAYYDLMNKEGYNENGNPGSVHDYFLEQSYGQFNMTFDVVGPVTVSHDMAYYGSKQLGVMGDHAEDMVYEACQLAGDLVDYSDYDWNDDGEVEMVYVVFAGYGASSYPTDETNYAIWPHEYFLSRLSCGALTIDGMTIDRYACSNELYGTSGTEMEGIGTPCHEFSHCLDLPDFYDSNYEAFGMGDWSALDLGVNLGGGYTPCGYTSYERMFCGWLTPTVLNEPTTIEGMRPLAETPEAYIIYNDANTNEYYLLENRQLVNSDASLEGHGLLVLHVDYDQSAWNDNTVNDDINHQRCSIIAADNETPGSNESNFYDSHAGDPYPGTTGNTALTDTTTPAATLFNLSANGTYFMSKPITDITETTDGLISFNFMGGSPVDGIRAIKTAAQGETVRLYTADGRYVVSATPAQLLTLSLPAGIYIVKSSESVSKIIIK